MDLPKTKRYPSYKDTGVDWLGEIPEHWEICKTKYIWKEVISLSENEDENLLSVSQYTGVSQNNNDSRSSSLVGYKKVIENNLVINIMLAWLGGVGLSQLKGVVSPAYSVYELLIRESYPSYFHYLYRTSLYLDEFARKSKGVVPSRWRMYTEDFGQVLTICPPPAEQKQIADYLDKKTGQIDIAINQKEQMIELLKERKQIFINRAVTRGLNPDVPLKYSGIEWIGQIPEHWEVRKLKYIFDKIQTGKTPTTSMQKYFNGSVNWYNPSDLNKEILIKSEKTLSHYAIEQNVINIFPKNSVLIIGIGGTSGKTAYLSEDATFNQQITGFHSNIQNNKYLFFVLKSNSYIFLKTANYTTLPIINNEYFKGYLIALPPLSEQQEIVSYIEQNTEKIDRAIAQKQQEIEKLKEYKATLIDSAVTGKICLSD